MLYREDAEITIPLPTVYLRGELVIPLYARSIIIFSHGSGSSRLSPRNKMVARTLQGQNFGTLLFDLLTPIEGEDVKKRFDIQLLTHRLIEVTQWLTKLKATADCAFGFFGASTGAASALRASCHLPEISAIVSRGGRPDLAMNILSKVKAPTLLIVGGLDKDVLRLNQQAYAQLHSDKNLSVIEGATHLFEEEGAMDRVCAEASSWFRKYLCPSTIPLSKK